MDSAHIASLERRFRRLRTWNVVLTILLLFALAGNAGWVQAAADPPVQVYAAAMDDPGAGGTDSGLVYQEVNPTHTTDAPLTLLSLTTNRLSRDHDHICVVTASTGASLLGTNAITSMASFGLSRGGDASLLAPTLRTAHLVVTSDEDVFWEEVTTTHVFFHVRRNDVIRFVASWDEGGPMSAGFATMTVVCLRDPVSG